ncbi:transmembrane protein 132D-like protein [Dinothrombium tinctorium]|uniref:Transmembrane protein 132D-like protein n=1 Tax=Dinothrombium tinctorium TaxID=1965070 RepID=A0A443R9S4_9ACAR|nr:transmembrane protein 132D-like protein [Dinothrombium tinctorium]
MRTDESKSSRPVTVRSSFGPLSVRQTIFPPFYESQVNSQLASSRNSSNVPQKANFSSTGHNEYSQQYSDQKAFISVADLSAILVSKEVHRNSPVLRVLFYAGHTTSESSHRRADLIDKTLCAIVFVQKDGEKLLGSCSPSNTRERACLAEITLPASWWPPVDIDVSTQKRHKPSSARVEYSLIYSNECTQTSFLNTLSTDRNKQQPHLTFLGDVSLSVFSGTYEEVTNDDIIRILIPQEPTYPNSKIYIPVCFHYNPNYPLAEFSIRVRVKSGLRILGAQLSPPSPWQITVEVNNKQSQATVTAFLRDEELQQDESKPNADELFATVSQEVFSWLFEVDDNADFSDNGRVVWQLMYTTEFGTISGRKDFDKESSKLTSRIDIQKDEVQAVIAVVKTESMINTAVLNGRQVSQPLRVFVVSQAGLVGDVTLQSNCHSLDESILKVSPSCTSVYLDGSEVRGSSNATVVIKYGTYTGSAHFAVWMPTFPLEIKVSDLKLSQIKGWKTPHLRRKTVVHSSGHSTSELQSFDSETDYMNVKRNGNVPDETRRIENEIGCRLRYQQANINVYTRFLSSDHNSGRESSLLNRRIGIEVTQLVMPYLKVSDPKVAILRRNIVEGIASGKCDVQIVSPITGRIVGSTEIKVGNDKETISQLEVNLVAGLSLEVVPDDTIPNVWIARSSITQTLNRQYQEGLLDIKVHFSDRSIVSLSDITDSDYHISINTFKKGTIDYAPVLGLSHPRVIAVGQGKGKLLHVSLEIPTQCQRKRTQLLSMSYVDIVVDFTPPPINLQNDADFRKNHGILMMRNQTGINSLTSSFEETVYEEGKLNVVDNHFASSIHARHNTLPHTDLTPLQVGVYCFLGVFGLAVTSCMVFAMKFRGKQHAENTLTTVNIAARDKQSNSKSTAVQQANNWVWLGKATLERGSVKTKCSDNLLPTTDLNGNPVICSRGTEIRFDDDKCDKSGQRMSTISYPGSEISIRITTNPVDDVCEEIESKTNASSEMQKSATNPSVPDPPPIPTRKQRAAPSALTYTKVEKNIAPPIPPHGNTSRHMSRSRVSPHVTRTVGTAEPSPPPIPPHRIKILSSTSKERSPPPVPPHSNNGLTAANEDIPPPVPVHQTVGLRPKIRPKVKPKSMGSIPAEQLKVEIPNEEWDKITKEMDYNQLLKYFESLKESSA